MGKLPAFLFYPKDWRDDPALLMCSRTARSVWIDMLCLMFAAPVRGVCCSSDGEPWRDREIAKALGGDISTNMACIRQLLAKGVASRNERGAIYSRRMVNDERERQQNANRQALFRSNGKSNAEVTQGVTAKYGNENRYNYVNTKDKSNTRYEKCKLHPNAALTVWGECGECYGQKTKERGGCTPA